MTFGSTALSDTYDPWLGVDYFGRSVILTNLDPTRKSKRGPQQKRVIKTTGEQVPPEIIRVPKRIVRTDQYEINQSTGSLLQGSSKS